MKREHQPSTVNMSTQEVCIDFEGSAKGFLSKIPQRVLKHGLTGFGKIHVDCNGEAGCCKQNSGGFGLVWASRKNS
jgi:hypothetical protein